VYARELPAPEVLTEDVEKRDDRLWLQNALAKLPAKQRRALTAHFVDGIPTREIARRDGVPLGTVLSRIFTGKQLLREAWERSAQPKAAVRTGRSLDPQQRKHSRALAALGYNGAESPDVTRGR
jgi:predicted RNA polymerase sigma factor